MVLGFLVSGLGCFDVQGLAFVGSVRASCFTAWQVRILKVSGGCSGAQGQRRRATRSHRSPNGCPGGAVGRRDALPLVVFTWGP